LLYFVQLYRDKKVVGVFVRFSCAFNMLIALLCRAAVAHLMGNVSMEGVSQPCRHTETHSSPSSL
jgi:hypothetical protein